MSADSCDVLIVGGGPAGSTCARALKQAGLDVLIMDKAVFPRDKVCAGWITPQVVQELSLDLGDYARGRVLQPIDSFITGMGEQANAEVSYQKVVSYGIRRCEFDHYLLERSGARLRLGEAWKSMEWQGGRWLVNGEVSAALVIGAGGHFCPVARHLGAHLGKEERAISAQEIEFEMTDSQAAQCAVTGVRPELYFCEDLKGYGWCFRKGNYLNVGLGREGNHRLAEHVQTFARSLAAQGRIPPDLPGKFKGHAYLLYAHGNRPVIGDGIMIIGDAAGLAYTQSGEGIRPAIESGLMAATNVLAASGDYRRERLVQYETALRARFGERGEAPALSVLPAKLRLALARALMRTQWFARNVILDRWFLHSQLPALNLSRSAT
ncbi:NAD(P)/FAD-dependent oxidoreductase [Steroidobacter sp. S1-65]|uniref:NAD(P)/FAD-dependent oxidoreductase n=1 Tax=Steroidobacter gossypii TaxID=2805490 RepID=A0ABS1X4N2_9GAMM|nr:NAD(P)/FAD-dependent oxidoreductase [Steroidobacter gossypii]MBM0108179.1 NAD(P)/FAD-dependent oxidoreductase [Steroidobacter gossypii]